MSTTSLLQTALQNLHVSQMTRDPSLTPASLSTPSSPRRQPRDLSQGSDGSSPHDSSDESFDEDEGDEDGIPRQRDAGARGGRDGERLVKVGKGTRPGTPVAGKGMVMGQRIGKVKDPVSNFGLT